MKQPLICIYVIVLITLTSTPVRADSDLIQLHYDLEIASYCGLVSQEVLTGFNFLLAQKIESDHVTQEENEKARMQAWKEAYREWENRGLGGFKAWCLNDVTEASQRLKSGINQE